MAGAGRSELVEVNAQPSLGSTLPTGRTSVTCNGTEAADQLVKSVNRHTSRAGGSGGGVGAWALRWARVF